MEDMFKQAALDDFLNDSIVKCTEKVVVTKNFWLMTEEGNLDLTDMYTCMCNVKEGSGIYMTDKKQIAFLKRIGALESEGSNAWMSRATAGPNIDDFLNFCVKHNVERDDDD